MRIRLRTWLSEISNVSFQRRLVIGIGMLLVFLPQPGHALTISPPVIEETLAPGQQHTRQVRLYNETKKSVVVHAEIARVFPGANETLVSADAKKDINAVATFLPSLPAPFTLEPGKWVDAPVTMTVPAGTPSRTYVGTLLFTALPTDDQNGHIGIIGKVGTVLIMTVAGPARVDAALLDFRIAAPDNAGTILDLAPKTFEIKIKNSGDVLVVPEGEVVVQNMFGRVVERLSVNEDARRVLPGWIRTFFVDTALHRAFAIGHYQATLRLVLAGRTDIRTLTYWVLPWKTIGATALATILFVGMVLAWQRKKTL